MCIARAAHVLQVAALFPEEGQREIFAVGLAYYWLRVRGKQHVLTEHSAAPAPVPANEP
jgi:hypothetical protein